MKDEFDFDEDDDVDVDQVVAKPPTSPPDRKQKNNLKDASSPESSISSKSKSSTASQHSVDSAMSRKGRRRPDKASPASSSVSGLSQNSSFAPLDTAASITTTSQLPRTRTARLKAKGIINKSPNRTVRFAAILSSAAMAATASSNSSDASSSAATVPSANHGYRSFAERPMKKRKHKSSIKQQSNRKNDKNEHDDSTNEPSNGKECKLAAPLVVCAATVDVYAIQDTVKVQRLADELRYCCDTIRNSRKTHRQLEALADLSLLLSNRKTRWSLFFSSNQQQGQQHDTKSEDSPPLAVLLQLMKWVKEKMGCSVVVIIPSPQDATMKRTKSSRTQVAKPRIPIVQEGLAPCVAEAASIVWHFLSMDCTMTNDSSSSASRKLREGLLSRRQALQGLLEMVVSDSYLNSIMGKDAADCPSFAEGFSQESGSSLSSSVTDSPGSNGSVDPTKEGRQRKRIRRLIASVPKLDVIPENGLQLKHAKDDDTDDLWSFKSESVKSRDHDSVSSAASQAADAETQLNKVLEKVRETVEEECMTEHSCGIEKNDLLARLPLLSLCRIVSGKMEGSDKSCIDEDMDENPLDDDEDELSRNPLLRTNMLLADSGAIPYIARATSNAAVAIVHYLTHRAACAGCESYLRWKFCKLTSLVDDACLLTDSNRSAFSAEGFAAETGGCLLVNLATVLKSLMDQNKLLGDSAWGDVAGAALRSLTSLTHDNKLAARDLESSSITWNGVRRCTSLSVLVDVLYETSQKDVDMTIFCLNTLANTLESGDSWEPFAKLKVGEEKESFLLWLTKHVVAETESFQEAVVETSFGSSQDRHSERHLDKSENEALMMAGNAFIFLAYVLVRAASAGTPSNVEDDILGQLPGEEKSAKLLFLKNTLKAFCNLYHFSVGALSLAIVAPVKKLLAELETVYSE